MGLRVVVKDLAFVIEGLHCLLYTSFGKKVLREVDENQFWDNLPDIKKKISDRAVLRLSLIHISAKKSIHHTVVCKAAIPESSDQITTDNREMFRYREYYFAG